MNVIRSPIDICHPYRSTKHSQFSVGREAVKSTHNVTVERPNSRVIGHETQHSVAVGINDDGVSPVYTTSAPVLALEAILNAAHTIGFVAFRVDVSP